MRSWRLRIDDNVVLAVEEYGDPARPAVALGHGAGSVPAFVVATFADAVEAARLRLVTWHQRGHGASTAVTDPALLTAETFSDDLGAVARATGARLVGGISLGAHSAVRWAARHPGEVDGLLLAAPGWTGPPDDVARANAVQADELARLGVPAVLQRVREQAPPWLAAEVETWWPAHDPAALIAVLRTLADSPGPSAKECTSIGAACGVAGLAGDPLHPAEVARHWAGLFPRAAYEEVPLSALATDRGALGRAAVRAWQQAVGTGRADGPAAAVSASR